MYRRLLCLFIVIFFVLQALIFSTSAADDSYIVSISITDSSHSLKLPSYGNLGYYSITPVTVSSYTFTDCFASQWSGDFELQFKYSTSRTIRVSDLSPGLSFSFEIDSSVYSIFSNANYYGLNYSVVKVDTTPLIVSSSSLAFLYVFDFFEGLFSSYEIFFIFGCPLCLIIIGAVTKHLIINKKS